VAVAHDGRVMVTVSTDDEDESAELLLSEDTAFDEDFFELFLE
jgi:hypothetical protein